MDCIEWAFQSLDSTRESLEPSDIAPESLPEWMISCRMGRGYAFVQPQFRSPEASLVQNTAIKLVAVANPARCSSVGARCTFTL